MEEGIVVVGVRRGILLRLTGPYHPQDLERIEIQLKEAGLL